MKRVMLTTIDNPHSPFDNFDAWYRWDEAAGYHTSGLLARHSVVSHELPEIDFDLAIEQAIDDIVSENISGVHRKVVEEYTSATQ